MISKVSVALAGVLLGVAVHAAQKPAAPAAPPSGDVTRAIVKTYLEVQAALAADRFEDVKGPARSLASQAAALGREGADLAKAATAFAAAADIAAARTAFAPLSDAVIARVKSDKSSDAASGLKLGYCPMVRQSWLQNGDQVRNPYYGTRMLTCGELKGVK